MGWHMLEIKKFPQLTFDEESHIYKLNGFVIPSVTTLMKPLSEVHYKGIDDEVLLRAAERGTDVHSSVETYANYGVIDIEPEFEGYLRAAISWMKEYDVKPFASESRLYHKTLRYAGTADMGCEERGINTLVDFKTASSISPMLCGVQLEAYRKGYESHEIRYDNAVIVQLRSDGTYSRYTDFPPRHECWKVFTSLLIVSGFAQKYK